MADFNIFGAKPSSNLEELYKMGLLGNQNDGSNFQDFTRKANRQSNIQGLLTGALSYLAQPKNQNFGSALPYLARAGLSGLQAAQQPFQRLEKDVLMKKKFDEMARQKAETERLNKAIEGFKGREGVTDIQKLGLDIAPKETIQQLIMPKLKTDKVPVSIEEFEYAKKNPDFKNFLEQKKDKGIEINMGGNKFADKFGTTSAELIKDSFNKATAAQTTLSKINDIRPALKKGVFSGPFSTSQRFITQIGSKLGTVTEDASETLKRTAEAMQTLAGFELNAAASMKGQGTITENERLLIQRAAAGRIGDFTADEINTLLNAMEKTSKYRIDIHNRNLSTIQNIPEAQQFLPLYQLPELKIDGVETSNIKQPQPNSNRSRDDILNQYGVGNGR